MTECEFCGAEFSDPADWRKDGYISEMNHDCPEVQGKVKLEDVRLDFACNHGVKGREEIRLVREWLYEKLSTEHHTVDATNLVTAVVYNLEFDYTVSLTGIYCDMWAGMGAETYDKKHKFSLQCDDIEDGFAYLYRQVVLELGEYQS